MKQQIWVDTETKRKLKEIARRENVTLMFYLKKTADKKFRRNNV